MWEINDNLHVHTHAVAGSPVFEIENVYKYPKKISRYLFNRDVPAWKGTQKDKYDDRRLYMRCKDLPIFDLLKTITGLEWDYALITNQFRAKYFPYKTHYWWIHYDPCPNAIVYFNEDDEVNGTNLYRPPYEATTLENEEPEIPKENVELLYHIKPTYNKLVIFDGAYFPHGMALNDDRYFSNNYRINQVFFQKYIE